MNSRVTWEDEVDLDSVSWKNISRKWSVDLGESDIDVDDGTHG